MVDILKVILLGIVEGITEWLPVSSTGHILIFERFIGLYDTPDMTAFKNVFDYVIQLGAILAVVVIYFKKLWPVNRSKSDDKLHWNRSKLMLWLKIIVACIPGAVAAFAIGKLIPDNPFLIAAMLIVYGIAFILVETFNKKEPDVISVKDITFKLALFIGLFQVLAIVPGTSRSGVTIIGAMLIGLSRSAAAEFTFYLAIPVMLGQSLLKIASYLKDGYSFTGSQIAAVIVGMAVSFVVSIFVIKFLMSFIKKHDFKPFGIYRIIVGIAIILIFALIK